MGSIDFGGSADRQIKRGLTRGLNKISAVDADEATQMAANRRIMKKIAQGNSAGGPSSMAFATGRPRDPLFYWKQNNLPYEKDNHEQLKQLREYCNTPDAPVWMADYSFKPLGEIVVGDEIIGWEWHAGPQGHLRKKLVKTTVLAINSRIAPEVVKVTMESGAVIRCTPDHKWANPYYSPSQKGNPWGWKEPQYRDAKVGRPLIRIIDPTPDLDPKLAVKAAWLGGIYDGEASGNMIAQSPSHNPDVYARIEEYLNDLGLPTTRASMGIRISTGKLNDASFKQHFVNFLNWCDPVRKNTTQNDRTLLVQPKGGREIVATIEETGPGEVISMQTGTGNYVVWGIASKNCSLLYESHPLISSCIDIYTQYPLQGAEIAVKDTLLQDFYEDLFFAEDGLNYKSFLQQLGRTYWTLGEAFPLGSFNESLGVWDGEELLNPDDVMVEHSAFSRDPRFLIRLPQHIREIMTKREPRWEYDKLMKAYPELARYAGHDELMPVSNILLQHLKFDTNPWSQRGTPILMRAMRSVMQEEMLNAAMDAIADRMYTPLVIAKLGASATDLGTESPWVPTEDEQEGFMESMDAAMAADFRVLITNFATQIEQVFGRENVPDFSTDFERLEDRILQSFGLSKTMLAGASSGETYAADAMNRDMVSQTLTKYQQMIQRHFEQRARVVAEAQEHYDYDERNGKRYVKYEEILEIDENGVETIVEQPKLLIPELKFRTMSLTDEAAQREFQEALRAAGIPISMKTRLMATGIDLAEEIEQSRQEQVELAVEEQETRKATYMALKGRGLPIPDDLRKDFDPKPLQMFQQELGSDGGAMSRTPMMGLDPTQLDPTLAPTQQDMGIPAPGVPSPGMPAMPVNADQADPSGNGVPESDEQRGGMPKPAALFKQSERTRTAARANSTTPKYFENDVPLKDQQPVGQFADPKVIGVRRYLDVDPETFYDTDGANDA